MEKPCIQLTDTQVDAIILAALGMKAKYPCLRTGQSLMNVLYKVQPEIYTQVMNTELDPFYVEGRVENFLKFLRGNEHSPTLD